MRIAPLLLATIASGALAGCTVGPDFARPQAPAATGYQQIGRAHV